MNQLFLPTDTSTLLSRFWRSSVRNGRSAGLCGILVASMASPVAAQVRTKTPDRDTYNPAGAPIPPPAKHAVSALPVPPRTASRYEEKPGEVLEPIVLKPLPSMVPRGPARVLALSGQTSAAKNKSEPTASRSIERASFENPVARPTAQPSLNSPQSRGAIGRQSHPTRTRTPSNRPRETFVQNTVLENTVLENGWDAGSVVGSGADFGDAYDVNGSWESSDGSYGDFGYEDACDSGCDGGCDSCGTHGGLQNASLCLDPCQWFASVELLLLFREGDLIPSLVTTSPSGTLGGVAGELPAATTLAGGENAFDELTAGGRLTLGTWLDSCRSRSLVFRGWTATEADFSYSDRAGINSGQIIAVPTRVGATPDAALIAFPNSAENFGRFGSVGVTASSNVFGGDLSVRQFWTGGLGTTFDVLYGYQYMRFEEDLRLTTSSTKTQDPFPDAIGNTLSTTDAFDAQNVFHGGQFGLAGRYREGCWSFDWLGKVGFGQVRRQAERRGRSVITTDTPPAAELDTGLLVNEDTRGVFSSSTFGWVPEFDVSIGWHKYPRFDVTFGYNIIAMTDAVRLSGVMDPRNTVDTTDAGLRYDTFVLQGMHFGIRHVY